MLLQLLFTLALAADSGITPTKGPPLYNCPDSVMGYGPVSTRIDMNDQKVCELYTSLPDSTYSDYIIITLSSMKTDLQAELDSIADTLFTNFDLRDYRDSSRLAPPSMGQLSYDSIMMTKATALALGHMHSYVIRTTFPEVPGHCPDKIEFDNSGQGDSARTATQACDLFMSLDNSDLHPYSFGIPNLSPYQDDAAHRAWLAQTDSIIFSNYQLYRWKDTTRILYPFPDDPMEELSMGQYDYSSIFMTKATALALSQEPYIRQLRFDTHGRTLFCPSGLFGRPSPSPPLRPSASMFWANTGRPPRTRASFSSPPGSPDEGLPSGFCNGAPRHQPAVT